MEKYRSLQPEEIKILENQGCRAEDWSNVTVVEDFRPQYLKNVFFSGWVKLGSFNKSFTFEGGFVQHSGMDWVCLHNCCIGNDVMIFHVANYIANYNIGEGTIIRNVDQIITCGESTFGNGVEVMVLNETGGREVPICNKLSSHLAYMLALYRHKPRFIASLTEIIKREVDAVRSDMGTIGKSVSIVSCGSIKNVNIGDACVVQGAQRLENGSINSNFEDPVTVGYGVTAQDFIISSGAKIEDGVSMIRCFVGQACHFSHNYSIHDSVFFANCQGENGEACAIFAGPYTVTMHKSSLLIAGMFSFMNAGSGSNQSNHMYKLGPIHQGILERGSKTASDSYILWPARIGAFSLVMGRHNHHSDTSDIPFSYLIENKGESYLVPAANLASVGTIRDSQKWPKRDNRKDSERLDQINFNLLSPFTIRKMLRACETLRKLQKLSGCNAETYTYQSTIIRNSSLVKGLGYYEMAIKKFLGNSLIKRLEGVEFSSDDDIRTRLKPDTAVGLGDWLDISGMIAPRTEIDRFINDVETGKITTVAQTHQLFKELQSHYYHYEWTWAADMIEKFFKKPLSEFTAKDVRKIVEEWRKSVVGIDEMLYRDAKKEFSMNAKAGFGVDGSSEDMEHDFEEVRGNFENNAFVKAVLKHIKDKNRLANELISRIQHLL